MEFVTTRTETEALLLEANLIKRLRPRFNVVLRDDKSFPYILIARDHAAPHILKHRGARNREGDYFGPFASAGAVGRTIIRWNAPFCSRSCSNSSSRTARVHALLFQIKRCAGPCTGEIAHEDYAELVRRGEGFPLRPEPVVKNELAADMEHAWKTSISSAPPSTRPAGSALRRADASGHQSARHRRDHVFAIHQEGGSVCIQVFFFRTGQELGQSCLFPARRPLAAGRRGAGRLPRAVLRRQALPAPGADLRSDRGARADCRSPHRQDRAQGRGSLFRDGAKRRSWWTTPSPMPGRRSDAGSPKAPRSASCWTGLAGPRGRRHRRSASRCSTTATSRAPTRSARSSWPVRRASAKTSTANSTFGHRISRPATTTA